MTPEQRQLIPNSKPKSKAKLPKGCYWRGNVIWISVYEKRNGKSVRVFKSAETDDPRVAERERAKLLVKLDRGEALKPVSRGITINDLLDDVLERISLDRTPRYYDAAANWASHARQRFGNMRPCELTKQHMIEMKKEMLFDDYAKASINHVMTILRMAFTEGAQQEPPKVDRVPQFPMFPASQLKIRTNVCGWADYERLRDVIDPSLKTLVVVLYHLGMRCGEALALTWDQIDFYPEGSDIPGVIKLNPGETKNHEGRTCPLYGDLDTYLRWQRKVYDELKPPHNNVFFWHRHSISSNIRTTAGNPIRDFRQSWENAVATLGLPGDPLIPHDMRRSCVTNMLQKMGMTRERAMQISGHKTESMLKRYNIKQMDDILGDHEKMQVFYQSISSAPTVDPAP